MKLIDKDKVDAEIEILKGAFINERDRFEKGYHYSLNLVISFLNTLEVKDVDLDKEINLWFDYGFPNDDEFLDYIKETAKHFYELGLKVQKGE